MDEKKEKLNELIEFKSGIFIIIKNLILYLIGIGFVAFLAYCFYPSIIIIIIAIIIFIFVAYGVLVKDNIKITIDDDYVIIYSMNKEKYKLSRNEYRFRYKVITTNGDSTDMLYAKYKQGKEIDIDCSNLGYAKFMKFVDVLKAKDEPIRINVNKKEN